MTSDAGVMSAPTTQPADVVAAASGSSAGGTRHTARQDGVQRGLYRIRELGHFESDSTLGRLPELLQQLTDSPSLSPGTVRVLVAD